MSLAHHTTQRENVLKQRLKLFYLKKKQKKPKTNKQNQKSKKTKQQFDPKQVCKKIQKTWQLEEWVESPSAGNLTKKRENDGGSYVQGLIRRLETGVHREFR